MTRMLLFVVVIAACGTSKSKSPFPPLLGKESKATVTAFEASCDERFTGEVGKPTFRRETLKLDDTTLVCEMPSHKTYSITFFRGDVRRIQIDGDTEPEMIAIFDRVFANIVPNTIRESMRRSITDPEHFDVATPQGGVFVDVSHGSVTWVTATKDEVLMGRPPVRGYRRSE